MVWIKAIAAVTLALSLSGCFASREQVAKQDADECISYGAQPGSQAYFQCRMAKDEQRTQIAADRRNAVLNAPMIPMVAPQMR